MLYLTFKAEIMMTSPERPVLARKTLSPLRPLLKENQSPVQTCPKCGSIYLSESECEACGFQLQFDPYGEAMGEKSFQSLKSSYLASMSLMGLSLTQMQRFYPERVLQYKRNLIHRYRLLIEYFTTSNQDSRRKFFLVELKDLIGEMIHYQVDQEVIWAPLDEITEQDDHLLYQIIQLAIADGQNAYEERIQNQFLYRRWFGLLTTGAILRITLMTMASVSLGLAVFRYLNL